MFDYNFKLSKVIKDFNLKQIDKEVANNRLSDLSKEIKLNCPKGQKRKIKNDIFSFKRCLK